MLIRACMFNRSNMVCGNVGSHELFLSDTDEWNELFPPGLAVRIVLDQLH